MFVTPACIKTYISFCTAHKMLGLSVIKSCTTKDHTDLKIASPVLYVLFMSPYQMICVCGAYCLRSVCLTANSTFDVCQVQCSYFCTLISWVKHCQAPSTLITFCDLDLVTPDDWQGQCFTDKHLVIFSINTSHCCCFSCFVFLGGFRRKQLGIVIALVLVLLSQSPRKNFHICGKFKTQVSLTTAFGALALETIPYQKMSS